MPLSKERVAELVKKHWVKAVFVLLLLFGISYVFNTSFKMIVVMTVFIVLGSFSTLYFNYVRPPIHFETVKLGTVLVAVAYGIIPGIVVGVVSTLLGRVLIGYIDERLPISLVTISGVAIAASIFSAPDIAILGIALVLSYNITMFAISTFLGGDIGWNLPYEGSNFLINLLWFTKVAPWLLPLIA